MNRLLFSKTGDGVFLSHLDLMRLFQRAFRRAGVAICRTGGMSPRDHVSITLPLSVGMESQCEILEFDVENAVDLSVLPAKLNATMPEGMAVTAAYESSRPFKELAWLSCRVLLEYGRGVPDGAAEAIEALLLGEQVLVEKRTKKGPADVDIRPLLRSLTVQPDAGGLLLECVVRAQEPGLNPALLAAAVERHLPQYRPDLASIRRMEVLDEAGAVFR